MATEPNLRTAVPTSRLQTGPTTCWLFELQEDAFYGPDARCSPQKARDQIGQGEKW